MLRYGWIVLVLASLVYGRQFKNPVIAKDDNPDPGAIYHNGVWYVVTTSGKAVPDKFPVHMSYDLQNWTTVGHIIAGGQFPNWTDVNQDFWAPGNTFVSYFTARNKKTGRLGIGKAVALDDSLTKWNTDFQPLFIETNEDNLDPSLLKDDQGNLHLIWSADDTTGRPHIGIMALSADGLSVTGPKKVLLNITLSWEVGTIEAPWHLKHGDYHYIFYSGDGFCGEGYAVGVARSANALGPYEKKGDPILAKSADWKGPGHCSVVIDPLGGNDAYAIIYHAWKAGQVCGGNHRLMNVQSLLFGNDGWPYVSAK